MEEMVKGPNYVYCIQEKLVVRFGYPVCEMSVGTLYVLKEQSKKGRVMLVHKKHVDELINLADQERNDYFTEIIQASRVVHRAFDPGKMDYGVYGGTGYYLHFHTAPKYQGGEEWSGTFEMNSQRTMLSDGEYEEMAEALRKALREV